MKILKIISKGKKKQDTTDSSRAELEKYFSLNNATDWKP